MSKTSVSGLVGAIRGAVSRHPQPPGPDPDPGPSYRYDPIPAPASHEDHQDHEDPPRARARARASRGTAMVKLSVVLIALLGLFFAMASISQSPSGSGCELVGNCTEDASHLWGQYSPYFSAPSDMDPTIPPGCEVTFAQVLSRHGARYPTTKKSAEYAAVLQRIRAGATSYGRGFEFLEHYDYALGSDNLTALGERQMAESGAAFFRRYEALARNTSGGSVFARASGSPRVVASAESFTRGFYGLLGSDAAPALAEILVIPETDEFNNTLEHVACPLFEDGPFSHLKQDKKRAWLETWAPPIKSRLDSKLPGSNLTLAEVVSLMDLCPFSTVGSPTSQPLDSRFCRLFTLDEWTSYDYHQSLDKWYGYGQGNPLGPSQGIGFGNELIARLTGQPVRDNTTTNRTLDASDTTFPLDRRLYADFSHDNTMSSIFAALGLYRGTRDLPSGKKLSPRKTRGFSAAWAVPFSARLYVEKMRCRGADKEGEEEEGEEEEGEEEEGEEMVRVLLNDRVVVLDGCGMDGMGRCALGAFVESLSFVRGGGLWEKCQDV